MTDIIIAYENCLRNINFKENFEFLFDNHEYDLIINLAYNIKNLSYYNLKRIEDLVFKLNDKVHSYTFSKYVEIANVKEHQNIIINSNSLFYIYIFAKHVNKSDKQLLSQIVLESLDKYWINKYYDHIDFDKKNYNNYFKNLIFI